MYVYVSCIFGNYLSPTKLLNWIGITSVIGLTTDIFLQSIKPTATMINIDRMKLHILEALNLSWYDMIRYRIENNKTEENTERW